MTIKKVDSRGKKSVSRTKSSKKVNKKRAAPLRKRAGVVGTAIEAAVEIGHAAESLQESFGHVKTAQQKGKKIVRTAKRAIRGK